MVTTRTIAVVLVLLGGVALAFPTMATEGFDTERPTSFSLGSGSNAAISAEQTDHVVRNPGMGNPAEVGRLVNNLDTDVRMTYRVTVTDPAIEAVTARDTVRLYPDESTSIAVRCLPPGQEGGEGTTTVTATVESAQGGTVGIENAEFEFLVEYECGPGGPGGPPADPGDGNGNDGPNDPGSPPDDGEGDDGENEEDAEDNEEEEEKDD